MPNRVYDTAELARFETILAAAIAELGIETALDDSRTAELHRRMAAAIFDCAAAGEDDPDRIKDRALAAGFSWLTLQPRDCRPG